MTHQPAVEPSAVVPGSPERSGSLADVLDVFETDMSAEPGNGTPVTPAVESIEEEPTEEPVEVTETETEPEYTPEAYEQAYRDLLGKTKELDDKIKGVDKYFTDKTEEFKKLREEAGVEELKKGDKEVRQEAKTVGEEIPKDFVARDYMTDERIDAFVKRGAIDPRMKPTIKQIAPMFNVALNEIRLEYRKQMMGEVEKIRAEYTPVIAEREAGKQFETRKATWGEHLRTYGEKYGTPEEVQIQALSAEFTRNNGDNAFWKLVDTAAPEDIEAAVRRVVNDPAILGQVVKTKTPPAPKKSVEPKETPPPKKGSALDDVLDIFG